MSLVKQVVWKEGTFISQQHFQQQTLHSKSYIHNYAKTVGNTHQHGLCDIAVNTDLLKMGKIAITQCFGIFPDGHYFNLEQEIILDVPEDAVKKTVYLIQPIARQGSQAFADSEKHNTRFITERLTCFDNASEQSDSVDIEVARDNVSLAIGKDDMSGYVSFPIARILETKETGEVIFDSSFVPACIHIHASIYLADKVQMLQSLLQNRAEEVQKRIAKGQGNKSDSTLYKDFLWLQTLNRWLPWAQWLQTDRQSLTYQLYIDLKTLSAELSALSAQLPKEFPELHFDKLYSVFNPIFTHLREQLSLVFEDSVVEINWDTELFSKRRLLRAMIKHPDRMLKRRFVLAVQSPLSVEELARVLPTNATLAGSNSIVELVRNAMSGVELTYLPVTPNELKPKADTCYFEINVNNELWREMLTKGELLTLHIDNRIPDIDAVLYAL